MEKVTILEEGIRNEDNNKRGYEKNGWNVR